MASSSDDRTTKPLSASCKEASVETMTCVRNCHETASAHSRDVETL
jgi:hypothetical protein